MQSSKKTYHLTCISEALSPITYGMKTAGNSTLIARESVALPGGRRDLPILWANGLKHQLLREHGAAHLLDRLGIDSAIDERIIVFLFNGGVYHLGGGHDKTSTRVDAARLFPLVSLAGGCLPGQFLHGAAIISSGYLICTENIPLVRALLPAGFSIEENVDQFRAAEEYIGQLQNYKHDGRRPHADLLASDARTLKQTTGKENPMMPHGGECVLRGAVFAHRIILNEVTEVELGCMLDSIARWQHAGAAIGGQLARGNGTLKISIYLSPDVDQESARSAYLAHVDSVKNEAVSFLNMTFDWTPPAEGTEKKGKKPKRPKGGEDADANLPIGAA